MILACAVFGYSLNVIGNIINDLFKLDKEIENNLHVINKYMYHKNVNKDLQFQIREYLEYYWRFTSEDND